MFFVKLSPKTAPGWSVYWTAHGLQELLLGGAFFDVALGFFWLVFGVPSGVVGALGSWGLCSPSLDCSLRGSQMEPME